MKVAAYSIALNEEKHAARWAETTKGADIRVVCDTGSTDRTVEILREHGVIVYEVNVKPWRFDTARNVALALIPSDIDVCLSLDLDETLDEDFFDKVKEHWVPGATRGWCDFDTGHVWSMCRLHARNGMYWKWPIHEVFVPSLDTKQVDCNIPTKMYHKPDSSKPRSQYLPMLVAACAEEGNAKDHRLVTYLCREYTYYREWELVISTAKRLLAFSDDWVVERAAVCRWASDACRELNRLDEAMSWADRAIELDPCGENYYAKVSCYYSMRDWGGMWETSKLVATCAPTNHYLSSGSLWTWQLNDMRALSAHNLGDKKKAVLYGQMALDANPTDQRLANNIKFYEQGIENIEEISAASGPATSIFESIYKNSHWGNGSGPGSTEEATVEYRKVVQDWVDKGEIKTVLDLGCGDWQFSKLLDFSSVHYTGVDVVPDVIAQNDKAYGSDNIEFVLSDALNFDFPEVDLILCKDVLQHLPNADVDVIVKRIQKAAKYALICNTTYTHDSVNYNITPGGYRGLDLKLPPFSLDAETLLQWETAGAPKRIDLITRKD